MPRYQKRAGYDKLNVGQLITQSSKQQVESLTAASTLDASDSGKIFTLDNAAGFVITMPSPGSAGAGWSAQFILSTALSGGDVTIVSPDNFAGSIVCAAAAAGSWTQISSAGTITFDQSAGVVVGDAVSIVSNGSKYFVSGHSAATVGVTLT